MARRSVLFTPGDRPSRMRTAPETGADVVVFDLEDGVAPTAKEAARSSINEVLTDPAFDPDCEVWVRVNPTGIAADDDLDAVLDGDPRVDGVMLPKVANREDVETLASLLSEHGRAVPIVALLETAAGILNAEAVAAVPEIDVLAFGAEDLAADVGATRTESGTEVLYAREHVVLAASAAGVDAIDTIHPNVDDDAGLEAATTTAVELGFDGKMVIHPDQVPVVNDAFRPDDDRVEWAKRVLEARDQAERDGLGVFTVDGQMIDGPLIAQAERVLELADADE